jgi:hypothetical protein
VVGALLLGHESSHQRAAQRTTPFGHKQQRERRRSSAPRGQSRSSDTAPGARTGSMAASPKQLSAQRRRLGEAVAHRWGGDCVSSGSTGVASSAQSRPSRGETVCNAVASVASRGWRPTRRHAALEDAQPSNIRSARRRYSRPYRGSPLKRDRAAGDVCLAMADDPNVQQVQIHVPPELQAGVYANFAAVSSQTPHDFTIDFIQFLPVPPGAQPAALVVARVKVAQTFLMPLMQALAQHQTQVEDLLRRMQEQQDQSEGGEEQ